MADAASDSPKPARKPRRARAAASDPAPTTSEGPQIQGPAAQGPPVEQAPAVKPTAGAAAGDAAGHRQRLRARFMDGGPDAVADYELLELVLFQALPRRDVKPLAKRLIRRFGSFAGVISAEARSLAEEDGLTETSVASLKVIQAAALRLAREEVMDRPVLSSWSSLMGYLRAGMAREAVEQFRLIFLDRRNHVIADEVQQRGTVDHTPLYPREVVRRALELGATALILVHNHPSGDPTPSRADIDMTRQVVAAAASVDITVHDHVIVARKGTASFKTLGLL